MFHVNKEGVYDWKPEKVKESHSWCQNMVGSWMSCGEERIVVSNTFTQEWEMKPYYDWASEFGYKIFSLVVENRHNGVNSHHVPEETLVKMKDRFEIKL